jgi:hypothetical protein
VRSAGGVRGRHPRHRNSYVRFAKSEAGYTGSINVSDQMYDFSGASQEHVASAVVVALGLDRSAIAAGAKDIDVARLGKSIDLLVRARKATAILEGPGPRGRATASPPSR